MALQGSSSFTNSCGIELYPNQVQSKNGSRKQIKTKRHVSIEIMQDDENLTFSIKEKMGKFLSRCICRVPENLSKQNEKYYIPTLVSIGPFHRANNILKSMEDHKWRYFNTLLSRKPKIEESLDKCVKRLRELEHKARKCYVEDVHQQSNEFVQMMLLDGCFIIELFLKFSIKSLRRRGDTFFNTHEKFSRLRSDLMLLENQIPFFILRELFFLVPIPKQYSQSLPQLALRFFRNMILEDVEVLQGKFDQDFNHLLDLIHQCYYPTYPEVISCGAVNDLDSATKLEAAGIEIKKFTTESLLNINFAEGLLRIPSLKIQNHTEMLLRNLMAMEHCYHNCSKAVTSYVFLPGCLIQSKQDVKLLCKRKILTSSDKDEKITDLFKNIHVEVGMKEFYYGGLCDQICKFRKPGQQVWYQKIKQKYHKTPLGVVGFILAILLLVAIFTGILFAVLTFSMHYFK